MSQKIWKNKLFFGDNLQIMRDRINDESVDLIYLDPPFNSNANYNVLFSEKNGTASKAQVSAFEDTWEWSEDVENTYMELITRDQSPVKLIELIKALRSFLGTNDMMAYLVMMASRLVEMHRVLKPTGSIYLHCDPTASHYLKLIMDSIFSAKNFKNEIVWSYRRWPTKSKRFQRMHDIILFYSKELENTKFNLLYDTHSESSKKRWKGKKQTVTFTSEGLRNPTMENKEDSVGVPMNDVWYIPVIAPVSKERLGYPTQKPEALLGRIIQASSNEGDLVLDPFCGCGTTVAVAEKLKRRWIGIDVTHIAISLIRNRLENTFQGTNYPYEIVGYPTDLASAKALAEHDRYKFEWWIRILLNARPPHEKKDQKGADKGVDGYIYFFDDNSGEAKKIIIQVKSGKVQRGDIATLKGDLQREGAVIGAFVTLQPPTRPMQQEALSAGYYQTPGFEQQKPVPKIQILTVQELLADEMIKYPKLQDATFKQAVKKPKSKEKQVELPFKDKK